MLKQISILIIICFAAFVAAAQTEKFTAPVKWERYAVSDKSVSILFPRLPVAVENSNICIEEETRQHAAYTGGVVYGLTIVSKTKKDAPDFCSPKKKFDEKNFEDRLRQLRNGLATFEETKINQSGYEIVKIEKASTSQIYWFVNDFKAKRWFEFWTVGADKEQKEVKEFFDSFKIEKNVQGTEIGEGAARTIGDEKIAASNFSEEPKLKEGEKPVIQKVRIILQPRPPYTNQAREASTTGTVRLRVVFLANGSVGSIVPVITLPNGLTEQAIAAASKIVFIPAKRSNVAISSSVTLEYSFSIY